MPKPKLTPEIKLQADAIVARFNAEQQMKGSTKANSPAIPQCRVQTIEDRLG
jgi:hypothetical protein